MIGRRVWLAAVLAIGGCGGGAKTPDLARLPLVPGAQVIARSDTCDPGARAFCAIQLVLSDHSSRSSTQLLEREHRLLISRGWTGGNGDTGEQHAADSPGHKLRVTYATADGDLKGIDLGWIKRSHKIALTLSRSLFGRLPALSLMLEFGQR